MARSSRSISGPRFVEKKGMGECMCLYEKERYKSSLQFLAIAFSDFGGAFVIFLATSPDPSDSSISLKSGRVSGRNYTCRREFVDAIDLFSTGSSNFYILYPPANILQPAPKKPVSLLRAPCTNLVPIGARTRRHPRPNPTSSRIYFSTWTAIREPGRNLYLRQPSKIHRRGSRLKDGWIFMVFWNARLHLCPGNYGEAAIGSLILQL